MKKDKAKIVDEVWTQARVKAFLDVQPVADSAPDFHKLLKAYQSMRIEDFTTFVAFFIEQQGDIDAVNANGETVLSIIKEHRHAGPFVAVLKAHGAKG